MKKLVLILVLTIVTSLALGYWLHRTSYVITEVSIREISTNPQSFDGVLVRLRGYVVDTSVYMFGPKYVLRDLEDGVEIALGGKGGEDEAELAPYVSFVFDGLNYTQTGNERLQVVGWVRYLGFVTDFPPLFLDVDSVEPDIDVHQ